MMHGDTLCYIYGIPHFRLNWFITLTLEDGPGGTKLIKQQHDHLLATETFVYQLPLVGKWFEMVMPRVCAQHPPDCICICLALWFSLGTLFNACNTHAVMPVNLC